MKPGDRLVCAFVSPKSYEERFKEWPLHVTILPWFRSEISSEELALELKSILKSVNPFLVETGGIAQFGHNNNKKVNLVKLPTLFTGVEKLVRRVVKKHKAWVVDESTKRRRIFTPHVTVQKSIRLSEGDTFMCSKLCIVEQLGIEKMINSIVELIDE